MHTRLRRRSALASLALVALALATTATVARAQGKAAGLIAGVNFASLNGNDVADGASARTGFIGGLFVNLPVGAPGVSIEPELLYSMQGTTYDNAVRTGTLAVDYIKIPVLFKWSSNPGGKGVYLLGGPSIGFNVSCKNSGTAKATGSNYDGTCEAEDNLKAGTTFSADVGIGYTTGRFGIEGRYSFDWGEAFEITGTMYQDGRALDEKNSVVSILLRASR